MIRIVKNIELTGDSPFTYEWLTNGCEVDITPLTAPGITNNLTSEFLFYNETDVGACDIQLLVTDANNCQTIKDIVFTNPCEDLTGSISNPNGFLFNASITGGSGDYSYEWTYDENVWVNALENNEQIVLIPSATLAFNSSTLYLTVTDNVYGCEREYEYIITLCRPEIYGTSSVTIPCDPLSDSGYGNGEIDLSPIINFCDGTANWNTINVVDIAKDGSGVNSSNFTVSITGAGVLTITPTSNIASGIYLVTYTVQNSLNIVSEEGELAVILDEGCSPSGDTTLVVNACNCGIELCGETTVCIDLDDCVVNGEIDRSTVTIVTAPTAAGASAAYTATDNLLCYTKGGGGESADSVHVSLSTTSGIAAPVISIVISTDCLADETPPVIANNDACHSTCTDADLVIDVTGDITGAYVDLSTIEVTEYPSQGTLSYQGNGIFVFSPPPGTGLTEDVSFDYIVYNAGQSGGPSNTGTFTIEGPCAGEHVNLSICNTCTNIDAFDISDLHTDFTTGGTYTWKGWKTTFNGDNNDFTNITGATDPSPKPAGLPALNATFTGTIDFTNAVPGFYYFYYEVEGSISGPLCKDLHMLVLEVLEGPGVGGATYVDVCGANSNTTYTLTDYITLPGADTEVWYYGSSAGSLPIPTGVTFDNVAGTVIFDENIAPGSYQFYLVATDNAQSTAPFPFTYWDQCIGANTANGCVAIAAVFFEVQPAYSSLNDLQSFICSTSEAQSTVNLYDQYNFLQPGLPFGGTWTLVEAPSYPINIEGVDYSQNDVIAGDTPEVVFNALPAGVYVFRYSLNTGDCAISGTLSISAYGNFTYGDYDPGVDGICVESNTISGLTGDAVAFGADLSNCPAPQILNLELLLAGETLGGEWYMNAPFWGAPSGSTFPALYPSVSQSVPLGNLDWCLGVAPSGVYGLTYGNAVPFFGGTEVDLSVFCANRQDFPLLFIDTTPVTVTIDVCDEDVDIEILDIIGYPYNNMRRAFGCITEANADYKGSFTYDSGGAPASAYDFTPTDPSQATLNPALLTVGAHQFTYTDESIPSFFFGNVTNRDVVLTVNVVASLSPGTNTAVSVCQGDELVLFDELGGSPGYGGIWTEGIGGAVLPTYQGIVDTNILAEGVYTYIYTLQGSCGTGQSQVVVTLTAKPQLELQETALTPCTYEIDLIHPSATTNTSVLQVPAAGATAIKAQVRARITSDCSNNTDNVYEDITVEYDRLVESINFISNNTSMGQWGYFEYIKVYVDDGIGATPGETTVNIPLAPHSVTVGQTPVNSATLTGVVTVDSNDLQLPASFIFEVESGTGNLIAGAAYLAQVQTFVDALDGVIQNWMDANGYEYGSGSLPLVEAKFDSDGFFTGVIFNLQNRYNPSTSQDWCGLKLADNEISYYRGLGSTPGSTTSPTAANSIPKTTDANVATQVNSFGTPSYLYVTPCGNIEAVAYVTSAVTYTMDYNTFGLSGSDESLLVQGSMINPLSRACDRIGLSLVYGQYDPITEETTYVTPDLSGTCDNPTYAWTLDGETLTGETGTTIAVLQNGQYTAATTCDSGCIVYTSTIIS